jgi:hypothetical protein
MSELIGWLAYGLSLYTVLGAIHGLVFGHFLGREMLFVHYQQQFWQKNFFSTLFVI